MNSPESCSESNRTFETEDLVSEFYSSLFAQYQADELLQRFDDLCTEALASLSGNAESAGLQEWLTEERFSWRIVACLNACWEEQRHMHVGFAEEGRTAGDDAQNNLEIFCNLLEKEALPDAEKVKIKHSHVLQQPCDWPETLFTAKKPRFNDTQAIKMDPDGPFHGSALAFRDQLADEKIAQIAFAFLRTGRLQEAVDLYESVNQFWRAAALIGQTVISDEDELDIWNSTNLKLSSNPHFNAYERAIYGLLAGRVESVWPVCQTLNDYWWAAATCFLRQKSDAIADPIKYDLARMFDTVRDKAPVSIVQRSRMPIRRIQQLLVLEEIEDVIELCSSLLAEWNESDGFLVDLYRFTTHLAAVLMRHAPSRYTRQRFERFDKILATYSEHVAQSTRTCRFAPGYVSLITDPFQRVRALSTVLGRVPTIDDRLHVVEECITVLNSEDIYNGISQYLEDKRSKFTLDFKIGATELEQELIRDLEMFRVLDHPAEEVLLHGNALCRLCMSLEDNENMGKVVSLVESFPEWHTFELRGLAEEHDDIVEYLTFQSAIRRWFVATGGEGDQVKSSCRAAAEEVALSAIRILSKDWMDPPRDEEDISRVSQMRLIRRICLPKVLTTTAAILERTEMYHFVYELVKCVSVVRSDLCHLLSPDQIKAVLEAACTAAESFLCNGNDAFSTEAVPTLNDEANSPNNV